MPAHSLLRITATAIALTVSAAAFAQANEEGNAPENNAAATAPKMHMTHPMRRHHHHHRHYGRHRSSGSQRMGNGSNGTNPNNGVSGNTSGEGNAQTTNPQSNQ
ncbi:MAG TPA: hypothetical protein VKV96_02645 [Roseiarcus sp.]|nr:hypothetical protein [Roseiarcus sp.]